MEESSRRALLEPVRDMALNWNVDVAVELEEYMVRMGVWGCPVKSARVVTMWR